MIVHVPETATAPQLLVWAKLPLVVTLLTMSVVLPLLVRVTVLGNGASLNLVVFFLNVQ